MAKRYFDWGAFEKDFAAGTFDGQRRGEWAYEELWMKLTLAGCPLPQQHCPHDYIPFSRLHDAGVLFPDFLKDYVVSFSPSHPSASPDDDLDPDPVRGGVTKHVPVAERLTSALSGIGNLVEQHMQALSDGLAHKIRRRYLSDGNYLHLGNAYYGPRGLVKQEIIADLLEVTPATIKAHARDAISYLVWSPKKGFLDRLSALYLLLLEPFGHANQVNEEHLAEVGGIPIEQARTILRHVPCRQHPMPKPGHYLSNDVRMRLVNRAFLRALETPGLKDEYDSRFVREFFTPALEAYIQNNHPTDSQASSSA